MALLAKHISKETATDIALAHREIETAQALLAEIEETLSKRRAPDIRDAFGRRVSGLELGVPTGSNNSCRCFNVPWELARPILQAHIASQETLISVLSEKAKIEMSGGSN